MLGLTSTLKVIWVKLVHVHSSFYGHHIMYCPCIVDCVYCSRGR